MMQHQQHAVRIASASAVMNVGKPEGRMQKQNTEQTCEHAHAYGLEQQQLAGVARSAIVVIDIGKQEAYGGMQNYVYKDKRASMRMRM